MINLILPRFQGMAMNVVKARLVGTALGSVMLSEMGAAAREMRDRISSSPAVQKGKLRESVKVTKQGDEVAVSAGGPETTVNGYDYAMAVEFGTSKMQAEPFFWPTIRKRRHKLGQAIGRELSKFAEE